MLNAFMGYVVVAALLDIGANLCAAKSKGFQHRGWATATIVLILAAFTALAQAVKGMDLAVAYATWGALGIIGTALLGQAVLGHRLKPIGWVGIAVIIAAVVLIKVG
ncbi:SMR family transporter [Ferrimonas balearica]|uniref:SMR family transporter n=1 Tax=Ferrimonas balearica TaxID=44012 RepID=UPI001C992B65|nr:SMR family transporter [Ferrimonas balearica]MBY5920114.1 ligand-binding protein SH3 [Ferrimonas balearica]MBY5997201.1 ligand-binding protein SH3 [Ferrimonas balearica]